MASIAISSSLQIVCGSGSHHVAKKKQHQPRPARALGMKEGSHVAMNVEAQNAFKIAEQEKSASNPSTENSVEKFSDERWKKGTWDLNMFTKDSKIDWDGIILAGTQQLYAFFLRHLCFLFVGPNQVTSLLLLLVLEFQKQRGGSFLNFIQKLLPTTIQYCLGAPSYLGGHG